MEIDPETLSFRKPFTLEVVKCDLTLTNPTKDARVFKIKTTAPKTYCVRPNAGLVLAGESKVVQVLLQPMEQDPPDDFKSKDKFLVLTIPVSKTSLDALQAANADIWAVAESNSVGEVQEKKLRVSFLPALQAATGGKSTINVAAPATTTAVDAADSGTTAAQTKMYAAANPSSTGGTTGSAPNTQSSKAAAAPTAATAGGQSVSAAVPSKKFEQALKDKEDEIKRLQALAKQYKQAAAKSSSSKFVGSLVLVAVIGVLLAYLTGHYSNNSSFLAIVGTLIAFVIGKYSSAKH